MRDAELRRRNRLAERAEMLARRTANRGRRRLTANEGYRLAGWRAMNPFVELITGRHRGPEPDDGLGSCSAEVSRRMPAISTKA